ncbi:hypothetical protein C8J57DRAFT_1349588, partial [Mycena rebaudengoi]
MTEDELLLNAQRAEDKLVNDPSGMIRAEEAFYLRAYSPAELRTFHCENMHKMPRSGLDPSMLIGFASRDEAEWDEPLTLLSSDDDDELSLESLSDPEEECVGAKGADDEEGSMRFFDEGSPSASHGVSSNAS